MLLAAFAAAVVAAAPATPLDLDEVLRRARPAPARLAATSELAAAARELARSRGVLREGPVVAASAGPRRTPEGDDEDLALDLDLPLAAQSEERRRAVEALESARRDLSTAAEIESALALRLAYVDAWAAQEALELAARELDAVARWREVTEARVREGAEAPYETALVGAEVEAARLGLAAARDQGRRRWAELAGLAAVGETPLPLAVPALVPVGPETAIATTALARAARSRAELEDALAALATARDAGRWSLGASLAREGDEEVARLGLGYRIPFAEETRSALAARDSGSAERARRVELEVAALAARLAGARELAAALGTTPAVSAAEIDRALVALAARLEAGKDRPSEALPLRRQLVASQATALAAHAARLRAGFEIEALTTEENR